MEEFDYAAGGLREVQRRFVQLASGASHQVYHLVVPPVSDSQLQTACGQDVARSEVAQELLSAHDPQPFCPRCRRDQARQI